MFHEEESFEITLIWVNGTSSSPITVHWGDGQEATFKKRSGEESAEVENMLFEFKIGDHEIITLKWMYNDDGNIEFEQKIDQDRDWKPVHLSQPIPSSVNQFSIVIVDDSGNEGIMIVGTVEIDD